MVLRRRFALVLLLALCLLLLGCSSQSADSASGVSGTQTDLAYDESAGYDGSFEADYGGHKVVRSASLSIDSSQFDVDLAALYGALERYGGYVESSTIDGRKPETYKESGRRADLCLRVPSDQYYPFLEEVKRIGSLYQYSDNGQDITTSYVDTQTRLEVLRTQLDRLEGILAQSDNLSDILELENEISRVTLEIESLTSQLRQYDGLVNYATVEIGLYEENLLSGSSEEKGVGQRILAAALNSPISVMETAGEGGPWGMAILGSYLVNNTANLSLPEFLDEKVFAGNQGTEIAPTPEDVAGFNAYIKKYNRCLPIEAAAVKYN